MKDRLTKADWISHGLSTLASDGAEALKIGAIATRLKVSRGSFYWHFRSIAEFRAEILRSWQERTTDRVIERLEIEARPDRLASLLKRAFAQVSDTPGGPNDEGWLAEYAIRSWAVKDTEVAAIVASVDSSRVVYITELLVGAGVAERQAQSRARFMYWAYLGRPLMKDTPLAVVASNGLSELAALFET